MSKQGDWRNRLSDGITIVLSILAAFALDSWWDNYTIARNVENGIRAVSEELVDVGAQLDQRLAAYDRAIEFLSDALKLIESTDPNQVVQVPDRLMAGALYSPTIDPPTGALVAFMDSGLLAAVADRELRQQIGELPSRFEDGADDELSALSYVYENVRPTLERSLSSADFSAVLRQMPHYWALFRSDVPWAEPSVSVSVMASPDLHNAIASRLQMMEFARMEVQDLQRYAAATLAMTGH
jgi:hypothetical protein